MDGADELGGRDGWWKLGASMLDEGGLLKRSPGLTPPPGVDMPKGSSTADVGNPPVNTGCSVGMVSSAGAAGLGARGRSGGVGGGWKFSCFCGGSSPVVCM